MTDWRFHGVTTVAELKPRDTLPLDQSRARFPRRHNRGRIEAPVPSYTATQVPAFPRRHNRGRIEAGGSGSGGGGDTLFPRRHNRGRIEAIPVVIASNQSAVRFHGVTTVAELKLRGPSGLRVGFLVSTASQPWPN